MKIHTLFFVIFPMLKLAALVRHSAVRLNTQSNQILRIIPCKQKSYTSRLFSSLSPDDQNESSDVASERTKKQAKTFKGLTRMRIKKAVVKADKIGDLLLVYLYIEQRQLYVYA